MGQAVLERPDAADAPPPSERPSRRAVVTIVSIFVALIPIVAFGAFVSYYQPLVASGGSIDGPTVMAVQKDGDSERVAAYRAGAPFTYTYEVSNSGPLPVRIAAVPLAKWQWHHVVQRVSYQRQDPQTYQALAPYATLEPFELRPSERVSLQVSARFPDDCPALERPTPVMSSYAGPIGMPITFTTLWQERTVEVVPTDTMTLAVSGFCEPARASDGDTAWDGAWVPPYTRWNPPAGVRRPNECDLPGSPNCG